MVTNDTETPQVKYTHQNDELPLTTKNLTKMEEGDVEGQNPQNNYSSSRDGLNGANGRNGTDKGRNKKGFLGSSTLLKVLILLAILLSLVIFGVIVYAFTLPNEESTSAEVKEVETTPSPTKKPEVLDPEVSQGPSSSTLHMFSNGAVCSDSQECSDVGRNIFQKGGNVVDAAIATLLCNGITTLQSLGIGGGFLMNLYLKSEKRAMTIDARDVAPLAATKDMFANLSATAAISGPLSIAVPGEVAGYAEAFKHFGTMKWADIIEPSIKICEQGFKLTRHMHDSLNVNPRIKNDTHLRKTFVNNETNEFYPVGTHVYPPKELCQTYKMLAEDGPESFYKGKLAELIAEDLKDMGSIIVKDDLELYLVDVIQSILVQIDQDSLMYVIPPAGSGSVVSHIINILKGYNMTKESIANDSVSALTYHRMVEAFKFAYAKKSALGDLRFNPDATYLVSNLTSNFYGDQIRFLINDNETYDDPGHYGADFDIKSDNGTSHLSIIAPNGDAVSVTSSVNFYFGCGITGKRTGIIFNSAMDDFSQPGKSSYFGLPPAKTNFIEPRKRAMSSMSPTIVTDSKGTVKLVIGAAGGSKIPSAVSQIIARVLWFGEDIKQAIDAPRLHHQLLPNHIEYEYGLLKGIVEGLKARGHKMQRYRERGSVTCGIAKNATAIYVNADYRKQGGASGF